MQEQCKKRVNKSIECTVMQCANHCAGQNYCSLDKIKVITHEMNPTREQCTDCASFVLSDKECK